VPEVDRALLRGSDERDVMNTLYLNGLHTDSVKNGAVT
jgi:hypothetical protein